MNISSIKEEEPCNFNNINNVPLKLCLNEVKNCVQHYYIYSD